MRHKQTILSLFFTNLAFVVSPILCLICLFFACGHAPGQDVKITVNPPKSFASTHTPVSVAIQFESYGNIFLRKNLSLGENEVLLPKGPVAIVTSFFASQPNNLEPFLYTKLQQEVTITNNTKSLEIYYAQLKPVQYKKFGFIFKNRTKSNSNPNPLSEANVTVIDPISETTIKNPATGESLGFITDENGRASADIPMFGEENLKFLIQNEGNAKQLLIPEKIDSDNFQFYEVVFDKKMAVNKIPATAHYMDETKTIQEVLNSGKNPRFLDTITVDEFQKHLNSEFEHSPGSIDILSPLLAKGGSRSSSRSSSRSDSHPDSHSGAGSRVRTDNHYERSGRQIEIKCKPRGGAWYKSCVRNTTVPELKKEFGTDLGQENKLDFLLTDQDGYSIFSDDKSTREKPMIVTVNVPHS